MKLIQDAIEERKKIRFQYFAPSGESKREIEPYCLIFKWSSWYVWGYCGQREDFRLFKLNRMDFLQKDEEQFAVREVPLPDLSSEKVFPGEIHVKALFEESVKWRLVEEFGLECFEKLSDGRLFFEQDYTSFNNLFSWLLTFGDKVEVLEPQEVRDDLLEHAKNIVEIYEKGEDK